MDMSAFSNAISRTSKLYSQSVGCFNFPPARLDPRDISLTAHR